MTLMLMMMDGNSMLMPQKAEDKGADEIEIPAEDEELGAGATPGASGQNFGFTIRRLQVITSPRESLRPLCAVYLYNGEVVSDGRLSSPQPPIRSGTFYSLKPLFYLHSPLLPRLFVTLASLPLAAAYQNAIRRSLVSRVLPVAHRTLQYALVELSEGYRFVSGKLPKHRWCSAQFYRGCCSSSRLMRKPKR